MTKINIDKYIFEKDDKWFFCDETGYLIGPFVSEQQAIKKFKEYVDWLNEGSTMKHIKYQHFVLSNDNVLTIASVLDKKNSTICYGYAICNTKTDQYIKKVGNQIAVQRLTAYHNCLKIPVISNIKETFQNLFLNHNFLSWMIINSIVKDNSKLEKNHYDLTFSEDTYRSLVYLEFYFKNFKLKSAMNSFFNELFDNCNFRSIDERL